jgi:putative SOS response-associated peptidase YedK
MDVWDDPAGATVFTYTILTCEPNNLVATVHNRMPVILRKENEDRWLSGAPLRAGESGEFLVPYPAEERAMVRVSPLVNSPAADDDRVIRPLGSSGGTQTFLAE